MNFEKQLNKHTGQHPTGEREKNGGIRVHNEILLLHFVLQKNGRDLIFVL